MRHRFLRGVRDGISSMNGPIIPMRGVQQQSGGHACFQRRSIGDDLIIRILIVGEEKMR